jgi:hypothetical protein
MVILDVEDAAIKESVTDVFWTSMLPTISCESCRVVLVEPYHYVN